MHNAYYFFNICMPANLYIINKKNLGILYSAHITYSSFEPVFSNILIIL